MKLMTDRWLVAAAASLSLVGASAAQTGSRRKPVEFIVTSGPGGGTDNFARIDPVDRRQAQADRPADRRH